MAIVSKRTSTDSTLNQPTGQAGAKPSTLGAVPWGWLESLIMGLLALVGVDVLLGALLGLGMGLFLDNASGLGGDSIVFNFGFYAISRLVGMWLILKFAKRKGTTPVALGFRRFHFGRALGGVLAAALLLVVITGVAFTLTEKIAPSLNLDQEQDLIFTAASTPVEIGLAFIALVMIAPVVEEAVFRGLMLPALAKRWGWMLATIITSVLFGAIHGQLNVGIVTFFMGLLLAWLYRRSNSLWPAIMFHSLKNLVAFALIFG